MAILELKPTVKQHEACQLLQDNKTKFIGFGGGAGCFVGSTLVHTKSGYKRIDEIKVGEYVYSLNEKTNLIELKVVEKLWVYGGGQVDQELIQCTLYDGTTFIATQGHEFYQRRTWTPIEYIARRAVAEHNAVVLHIKQGEITNSELAERKKGKDYEREFGERILCSTCYNQRYSIAKELETSDIREIAYLPRQTVYDLQVADNHNYLITDKNIIVHNSGKSWLICEWSLTNAYLYRGSRGFIARNELKRLMNSTYITWLKVCKHHNIPDGDWTLDGKYNVIRFKNGSTIDLLDIAYKPTDPEYERFGSTEYTFGSIEEAGETHFKAFDVLKSRVGRHNIFNDKEIPPKMLCTFNPSRGWVYRVFYKPWKNDTLPESYAFVPGLYTDNPYTAKEYGEQLSEIIDTTTRERLMLGNWEYEDSGGVLMKYANIRDIFTNTITKNIEKYLTVDVARYGSDRIVFNFWEGLESYKREYYTKQSTVKTIQLIRDAAGEHKIPFSHIVIDDDGVGGGVVDQLSGVVGFVNNSSPLHTRRALRNQIRPNLDMVSKNEVLNFSNIKSQCAWKLAELVETHRIAVKNAETLEQEELTEELAIFKQKDPDKETKLSLIPKSDMKEALGRSPDIADTFIFRMYFELISDTTTLIPPTRLTLQQSFSPNRIIRNREI